MFRIRFHGRGGQGMKTASRILGTAFFQAGYEVQDAPRYGAERRGAPIFAYVRADKNPIHERGIINDPDLVVVADDTLVGVPAAGVLQGISERSVILIYTDESEQEWQHRLNIESRVISLPMGDVAVRQELPFLGAPCAGAAAALVGAISRDHLAAAVEKELAEMPEQVLEDNRQLALAAYEAMSHHRDDLKEGVPSSAENYQRQEWIDMPFEAARIAAPIIYGGANSVEVRTGLWRVLRPVIEYDKCKRCWWVCSTFCPDSAINISDGKPVIDYDHCKGCMICVAQCPSHAIQTVPEQQAQDEETGLT